MSDPTCGSIAELSAAYLAGKHCPIAHAEACLERIARLNPRLECFVSLADRALDQAAASRQRHRDGRPLGPLDGAVIAVKDNYFTADMPTTAGTSAEGIAFPRRDAAAVARLRAAGAVIIGKTATHEFAWGTVTPPVRNPWDLERVPGGSSGGSASALAAGLCDAALGSDTGGSIRIPASLCGTVGLKATFGAIGRSGIVPHSWSLDHAGPLARSVEDAAVLLDCLRGFDPDDPGSAPDGARIDRDLVGAGVAGLTIGICREHFFERLEPGVEAAVEAAVSWLAGAGATVKQFRMPLLRYGLGAIFAIELASSTAYHDASLGAGRTAAFQPDVRDLVEMGRLVSAPDYLKAEQYRSLLVAAFREVMDEVDVVVAPTEPLTAWRIGEWRTLLGGEEESVLAASWRLTYPFNLTGQPAITLPCGFDAAGMPIGLQIAGQPFDETGVLRVARAYEAGHQWRERRPSL